MDKILYANLNGQTGHIEEKKQIINILSKNGITIGEARSLFYEIVGALECNTPVLEVKEERI